MSQKESSPGRVAAAEAQVIRPTTRVYAGTCAVPNVPGLLQETAWALRVPTLKLQGWTCERARREALEALLVFEGQVEIIGRHIDALQVTLTRLKQAPASARYVGDVLPGGAE